MCDYYDFYEPSELEEEIENLKDSLRNSIKEEHQNKIKRLTRENAELREIKKQYDAEKREIEAKKCELETAIKNVRHEHLRNLLESFTKQAWGCVGNYEYIFDKCDKCDEDGYIHFKSPRGNDMREQCYCRIKAHVYKPAEVEIVEFNNLGLKVAPVFSFVDDRDGLETYKTRIVYNGENFEDLDEFDNLVFYNKEDCQRYCEYLNKKWIERYGKPNG